MSFKLDDFKDRSGKWVMCIKNDIQIFTIAGAYYNQMTTRCKVGGYYQSKKPTYKECINGFKDFQEFAEWCQIQVGYGLENYQLDKDILIKGNKIYSPETCVFVPNRLNMVLVTRKSCRGDYPIGVHLHQNKFRARATINGKTKNIGMYSTSEEAFYAYKKVKEEYIKTLANEYKNTIDSRTYDALMNYKVLITD